MGASLISAPLTGAFFLRKGRCARSDNGGTEIRSGGQLQVRALMQEARINPREKVSNRNLPRPSSVLIDAHFHSKKRTSSFDVTQASIFPRKNQQFVQVIEAFIFAFAAEFPQPRRAASSRIGSRSSGESAPRLSGSALSNSERAARVRKRAVGGRHRLCGGPRCKGCV